MNVMTGENGHPLDTNSQSPALKTKNARKHKGLNNSLTQKIIKNLHEKIAP
jgi:hypothetical protein